MKENKTYTIVSNTNNFTYEDYLDFCECNEIEPAGNNSSEFYEFCAEENQRYFEDDMTNIKYTKSYADTTYIIEGSLGLWWGKPAIQPVVIEGLHNALNKCFGSCDYVTAELDTEEGCVNVRASHHDGTNYFTIHALRKGCIDYKQAVENGKEPKDSWYTKIKVA